MHGSRPRQRSQQLSRNRWALKMAVKMLKAAWDCLASHLAASGNKLFQVLSYGME